MDIYNKLQNYVSYFNLKKMITIIHFKNTVNYSSCSYRIETKLLKMSYYMKISKQLKQNIWNKISLFNWEFFFFRPRIYYHPTKNTDTVPQFPLLVAALRYGCVLNAFTVTETLLARYERHKPFALEVALIIALGSMLISLPAFL